jgi:hypothetical protein
MAVNKKQMDEVVAAGIVLVLGLSLGYLIGAAFPPYAILGTKPGETKAPDTPPAPTPKPDGGNTT